MTLAELQQGSYSSTSSTQEDSRSPQKLYKSFSKSVKIIWATAVKEDEPIPSPPAEGKMNKWSKHSMRQDQEDVGYCSLDHTSKVPIHSLQRKCRIFFFMWRGTEPWDAQWFFYKSEWHLSSTVNTRKAIFPTARIDHHGTDFFHTFEARSILHTVPQPGPPTRKN